MAKEYYTVLTDIGAAKMAAAVTTGKKVVITEFAVGDGFGTKYSPSQEQTALKNEVYRGQIDDYSTAKHETSRSFWYLVVVGVGFILISLLMLYFYYKY